LDQFRKFFTSILILQLIQAETEFRGKQVSLTDNPERFLKQMEIKESEWSARYITFADLLAHTSGFGDMRNWRNRNDPISRQILKSRYLEDYYSNKIIQKFTPKSQWYPSIHNYGVLGSILEKIYSKPFYEIVQEKIIDPLSLENTSFDPEFESMVECYDKGIFQYHLVDSSKEVITSSQGGKSSVGDLITLLSILMEDYNTENYTLLQNETILKMFSPHFKPMSSMRGVGLPFIIEQEDPLILSYNNFQDYGQLKLLMIPEEEVCIVLSSNLSKSLEFNGVFDDITNSIFHYFDIDKSLNGNDGVPTWLNFVLEGSYRFSKSNRYNGNHNRLFGRDLFISRSEENNLELSSNLTYRKNRPWLLERRELELVEENTRGYVFSYRLDNHARKLFFPKSDIASYVILETPGPRLLYRSKSKQSFLKSLPRRTIAFVGFVFIAIFTQFRKVWKFIIKYSGPFVHQINKYLVAGGNWVFRQVKRILIATQILLQEVKPSYNMASSSVFHRVMRIPNSLKGYQHIKKNRILKNLTDELRQRKTMIHHYRDQYPSRISFNQLGKRVFKLKVRYELKQIFLKIQNRNPRLAYESRNVMQIIKQVVTEIFPTN